MNIGTLIIRIGMAAFLMAMAGKILRVTVAHSDEAPVNVTVTRHLVVAAMDLSDRPRQAKYAPVAAASPQKTLSPGMVEVVRLIRSQGVDCPTVMNVTSRAQDAYGRVFIVRCGSARGAGGDVFSNLRVTIQANGEAVISPEH